MQVQGKRILFIAPKYYDYHIEIKNIMLDEGAIVTYYPEMPTGAFYNILKKLPSFCKNIIDNRFLKKILNNVKHDSFDSVFIVRGEILNYTFLKLLRSKLPSAKFYMYQWDSTRQNYYEPIIDCFDKVQTFDMVDAKRLKIEYLPLFYTDSYLYINADKTQKKYDIIFYGAYHSDRLEIVKYFIDISKKHNLIFKHHLYMTKLAFFRLLITRKISIIDMKYLKHYIVSKDTIIQDYQYSKCVLDIELNIQNGLTIRTFEALGAKLKLITTNLNIVNEAIFDENNIYVLDRNNINFNIDFLTSEFKISSVVNDYYIRNWLHKIGE